MADRSDDAVFKDGRPPAVSPANARIVELEIENDTLKRENQGLRLHIESIDGFLAEDEHEAPQTRRFLSAAEIENLPKPEYRVSDILVMGALAVLYGPPGCFKSFLALMWAFCVATGFRFLGRTAVQGTVLYVAAEGSAGMGARVRALRKHHHYAAELPIQFLTSPANLINDADADKLLLAITDELDELPSMIVIDTLSRDLAGADENSQADMSRYVGNVDRIRRATGATVLIIHHTNASAERERGSTVLRGAADTMIQIKNDDGTIVVSCEKMKDDHPFAPIYLELVQVADSAVLTAKTALQLPSATASKKDLQALKSLHECAPPVGMSASRWLAVSEMKERTFYTALKSLTDKELVKADSEKRGALYTVTPEGLEQLTANCQVTANSLHGSNRNSLHASGGVLGTPQQCSNGESEADMEADLWEDSRGAA